MTTFRVNGRGLEKLLASRGVRAELGRRGRAVAAAARSTAPVDTGRLRSSIDVVTDTVNGRARVRVVANTPYAQYVAADNHWLSRALDEAR